jgi:excisionase family DNA binding protein
MAEQQQQSEYMTVAEAQHELGVHKRKMADLIKRGNLPAEENPFDRRSKLVRRADVAALKAKMPTPAKELAKSAA